MLFLQQTSTDQGENHERRAVMLPIRQTTRSLLLCAGVLQRHGARDYARLRTRWTRGCPTTKLNRRPMSREYIERKSGSKNRPFSSARGRSTGAHCSAAGTQAVASWTWKGREAPQRACYHLWLGHYATGQQRVRALGAGPLYRCLRRRTRRCRAT